MGFYTIKVYGVLIYVITPTAVERGPSHFRRF